MTNSGNVVWAFSADHVVRLTGLSEGQLRYWDQTGFFSPQFGYEDRRSPYSRVYSFRDVVGLRTIAVLRNDHEVSLQHLRQVAQKLAGLGEDFWSATTLYVLNKHVYFDEPDTGKTRGVVSGQYVTIPLVSVANDVSEKVKRLKERKDDQIGRVERHRNIAHNAWVFAGTRIPTGAIIQFKEAGYSMEQILREYPTLTAADVTAALKHAKKELKRA